MQKEPTENALLTLSNDLAAAVERVSGSIVAIEARNRFPSSGVHWRPGVVVTAAHTIKREEEITVTLPGGTTTAGSLVGIDRGTDVAVLKVETETAAGKATDLFQTAQTAATESLRTSALILAVGRSPSHGIGAALGIVSLIGEPWRTWRGGRIDRLIRLDVSLYPGFSGAAVVAADGSIHGIATSGLSRFSTLAIPTETIDRVAQEILTRGYVPHGYLGVGLQPVSIPGGKRGVIVLSVESGGPADRAGVLIGDILLAIDGSKVEEIDDVHAVLESSAPGRVARVSLLRGGSNVGIEIEVGERRHGR